MLRARRVATEEAKAARLRALDAEAAEEARLAAASRPAAPAHPRSGSQSGGHPRPAEGEGCGEGSGEGSGDEGGAGGVERGGGKPAASRPAASSKDAGGGAGGGATGSGAPSGAQGTMVTLETLYTEYAAAGALTWWLSEVDLVARRGGVSGSLAGLRTEGRTHIYGILP